MSSQSVVVASHSSHKYKEIQSFFAQETELLNRYHFEPLSNFTTIKPDENALTFVENALIKARFACQVTKKMAIADDSGLCVEALNGKPGVHSARFAMSQTNPNPTDEDNNHLLLEKLKNFKTKEQRQAHFVAAIVWLRSVDDPEPLIIQARFHGNILTEPRGKNGFGYDPYFYIPQLKKTAAELSIDQKNQISHRGMALLELKTKLLNLKA